MFLGEGAAQNGRMAENLNAAAKEKLPLLFLVIDNGRAINTFTPDVAANSDVFAQVIYQFMAHGLIMTNVTNTITRTYCYML